MASYRRGQKVTLTQDYGADNTIRKEADGSVWVTGPLLKAGTVGVVREVVPAKTVGAHDMTRDSVVVEFPQEGSDMPRAIALSLGKAPARVGVEGISELHAEDLLK